jgi:HSP20 family protein
MTIMRWRPTYTLRRPWQAIERFFDDDLFGSWLVPFGDGTGPELRVPAVDVYEEDGHVVVRAELPGVAKEHVSLQATADQLTLDAERRSQTEAQEARYHRRELHAGRFHRCIPLPSEVKHQEAKATFKDGVLEVRLPKADEAASRTIKVE